MKLKSTCSYCVSLLHSNTSMQRRSLHIQTQYSLFRNISNNNINIPSKNNRFNLHRNIVRTIFKTRGERKNEESGRWRPRWNRQILFFSICCIYPFMMAFGHHYIPGAHWFSEKVMQEFYVPMEKVRDIDFDHLPELTTKYDNELEVINQTLEYLENGEPDDDDTYGPNMTDEERAQLNREIQATQGQSIPNAS